MKIKQPKRNLLQKIAIITGLIASILIIISSISLYYFDSIIDGQIAKVSFA